MAKDHGPQIKDNDIYEALREDSGSKEKAARLANAAANRSREQMVIRGRKAASYEDLTKQELSHRAKEVGIAGRSGSDKGELVDALRKR